MIDLKKKVILFIYLCTSNFLVACKLFAERSIAVTVFVKITVINLSQKRQSLGKNLIDNAVRYWTNLQSRLFKKD
jgi:hypothetical protein